MSGTGRSGPQWRGEGDHEAAEAAAARVLVIDDEPDVARFIARAARSAGFYAEGANTAAEGVELVRTHAYALVVLDLVMPGTDGLSALRDLLAARPELPIVVLSGVRDVRVKVRC